MTEAERVLKALWRRRDVMIEVTESGYNLPPFCRFCVSEMDRHGIITHARRCPLRMLEEFAVKQGWKK
jgi:hypothetical protein